MPNPQVCMFCRYRRTADQQANPGPCSHGAGAGRAGEQAVARLPGAVVAQAQAVSRKARHPLR
jgi:hypothetical protein